MSKHSKTPLAERRAAVLELRRAGLSYRAIGEKLGMSAERARQLTVTKTADWLTRRKREIEATARLVTAMAKAGLLE